MSDLIAGPIVGLDPAEHTWKVTNSGEYSITVAARNGWRPYGVVLEPGQSQVFTLGTPIGWLVPPRGSIARITAPWYVEMRRLRRAFSR